MIKYDTWQVFWLSVHFTFPLINSGVREVTFHPSPPLWGGWVGPLYSYGDSAGITPASLLILRIEAEKPNSLQM
jgi:hypothetical protein